MSTDFIIIVVNILDLCLKNFMKNLNGRILSTSIVHTMPVIIISPDNVNATSTETICTSVHSVNFLGGI